MAAFFTQKVTGSVQVRHTGRPSVVPRTRMVVRAVDQRTEQETTQAQAPTPAVDFTPQKIEGYVEKDSAGQSNMYPTIPRPFEAGTESENSASATAATDTRMLAGGAGAIAALVVVAGIFALTAGSGQPEVAPEGEFLALSAYQAKFSSELGLKKFTPPAVVVSGPDAAPALVDLPILVEEKAPVADAPVAEAPEAAVEASSK